MKLDDFTLTIADQFDDININEVHADTRYRDLEEWSSMVALSILNVVQKKYGKSISFDDLNIATTIEELFNIVKTR